MNVINPIDLDDSGEEIESTTLSLHDKRVREAFHQYRRLVSVELGGEPTNAAVLAALVELLPPEDVADRLRNHPLYTEK